VTLANRLQSDLPVRGRLAGNERQVFGRFAKLFDLANAVVLEVGGRITASLLQQTNVGRWYSVDPRNREISPEGPVITLSAVVEKLDLPPNSVDLVFSSNAFQHIHSLSSTFTRFWTWLRPGGYLYSNFGPVWSAPDGSHIEDLRVEGKRFNFWEGALLPSWSHLVLGKHELLELLIPTYGRTVSKQIVQYVFHSAWINRLLFDDYIEIVKRSPFEVLLLGECSEFGYDYHPPSGGDSFASRLSEEYVMAHLNKSLRRRVTNVTTRDIELILRKT
jgi:SAM-dependent methyltransferase